MNTMHHHNHDHCGDSHGDAGFTLIELMFVVILLGILTATVAFAAGNVSAQAADTGCEADRRQLHTAALGYLGLEHTNVIPAAGADHDRFEQTLVAAAFLGAASTLHDLDATGVVTPQVGSPC